MTGTQFFAWLLYVFPALMFFANEISFKYAILGALIYTLIISVPLFIIAEKEFIKDCKKGYKEWEESILPQWFYRNKKVM